MISVRLEILFCYQLSLSETIQVKKQIREFLESGTPIDGIGLQVRKTYLGSNNFLGHGLTSLI